MQHHVNNLDSVLWPRCQTVSVVENRLDCVIDFERAYNLTDAYRYEPHTRFLNLKTQEDLVSFVRTWGPLYWVHHEGRTEPVSDINAYWKFQRWFVGLVKLVQMFEQPRSGLESLRESLREFLSAEKDWHGDALGAEIRSDSFRLPRDPEKWMPNDDEPLIRQFVALCIKSSLHISVTLQTTVRKRHCEVRAGPEVHTLQDAIQWMYWQDVFLRRPLLCCPECRTFFLPTTAHARKFCSFECAHRAAARKYARKKRSGAETVTIKKPIQREVTEARSDGAPSISSQSKPFDDAADLHKTVVTGPIGQS